MTGQRTERCESKWSNDLQCDRGATTRVVVGCKHEHINERGVCEKHVAALLAGEVRYCIECYYLDGHEHRCPIVGKVLTA